ncbi:hypothetical protein LJB42_000815 [Komagataella kurtzmanii]|nr:hypothetical protein LJB42_000815 [Komagataella kurtzmanii]
MTQSESTQSESTQAVKAQELPLTLSNEFLPDHYDLNLDILPKKPNFTGTNGIRMVKNKRYVPPAAIEEGEQKLEVVLHSLELFVTDAFFIVKDGDSFLKEKVAVKHNKAVHTVTFTLTGDKVELYRNAPFFQCSVFYMGVITNCRSTEDKTRGVFRSNYAWSDEEGKQFPGQIIATHCQPTFARQIFPCIDDVTHKVTIQLSIQTDADLTCISNTAVEAGELLPDEKNEDDGVTRKMVLFEKSPPTLVSLFAFVVGDLEFTEKVVKVAGQELPLRVYVQKGDVKLTGYALDVASKSFPLMATKFGLSPCPFKKLDFAALPYLTDGGMENSGLITIAAPHLLVEPDTTTDPEYASHLTKVRQVIVHEMVHQWMGNFVSFDDWSHMWFNEAFATWLALVVLEEINEYPDDKDIWLSQANLEMYQMMRKDATKFVVPIYREERKKVQSIQDAFNEHAYQKGLFVLRMLTNLFNSSNDDSNNDFFAIVSQFLADYKYLSIKPSDFFKYITDSELNKKKIDAAAIMYSWVRTPGFPIVSATVNSQGKVHLEQHRFLFRTRIEETDLEDVPYHIPVSIRLKDGTIARQMLTDRSIDLDLKVENVVFLNANYTNPMIYQYSLEYYDNIATAIKENKLSAIELTSLYTDLSSILMEKYQRDDDIIGLLKTVEAFGEDSAKLQFLPLNTALNLLEAVQNALETYTVKNSKEARRAIESSVSKISATLFDKLEWESVDYSTLPPTELYTRNTILSMAGKSEHEPAVKTVKQFYKKLTHGPKKSVPKQFLAAVLTVTARRCDQKEYKEIASLAKNAEINVQNLVSGSQVDIQTSGMSALGHVKNVQLIKKTLNHVASNITSKLIEICLLGFKSNVDARGELFQWFSLNYENWLVKAGTDTTEAGKQMRITLHNLTKIVFEVMMFDESGLKQIDSFTKRIEARFPKFEPLKQAFKQAESIVEDKKVLNQSNEKVIAYLN